MNKRFFLITLIVLGLVPTTTSAQCTKRFENEEDNWLWQRPNNWQPHGLPAEGDVACISYDDLYEYPSSLPPFLIGIYAKCSGGENGGKLCIGGQPDCPGGECIPDPSVKAGALMILGGWGGVHDTEISLWDISTLTLHGRHVCDGGTKDGQQCDPEDPDCPGGTCEEVPSRIEHGTLYLFRKAKLIIADDLTITGALGTIEGEFQDAGYYRARIEPAAGTSAVLTIQSDDNSSADYRLLIDESPEITVGLVNNAYVAATHQNGLILSGAPKSGSGYWVSNCGDTAQSVLVVNAEVQGSGTWLLNCTTAAIEINEACESLTGDVQISLGTLEVNENFDTTGDLVMTGGQIEVAEGKDAAFDCD